MIAQRIENVASWTSLSVGTTAVAATPTPNFGRTAVCLTNTSATQTLYLGLADSVTASFYLKRLAPGEFFEIQAGPSVPLYLLSSASGGSCSVAEVA